MRRISLQKTTKNGARVASAALAILLVAIFQLPVGAGTARTTAPTGRGLRASDTGQLMQSVNLPATLARVSVVPGSRDQEAWGFGFTHSRQPGYDVVTPTGQLVFLKYTKSTGWQIAGPPVDGTGAPVVVPALSAISMAANGEGWAVGGGQAFHRAPGAGWVLAEGVPAALGRAYAISIKQDASGVFGFAVGTNLGFLQLSDGAWKTEVANGLVPSASTQLFSISTADRDNAWSVGKSGSALLVMRRTTGGWGVVQTRQPIFDSAPQPVLRSNNGTINRIALGTGVGASLGGAWIGGQMQPVDATRPTGDANPTRPFAIRYDVKSDKFTSYCPRLYQVSSQGVDNTLDICDKPFPAATGDLPVIQSFEAGEALAGGFGLFHFVDGSWKREPSTLGYICSMSFDSPAQGWTTTPGDTTFCGQGSAASSTAITAGQWTSVPTPTNIARWPVPSMQAIESVAVDGSGSGQAMAVGGTGRVLRGNASTGWDVMDAPSSAALHSIAWPASDAGWAVGDKGTILRFDGSRWAADSSSGKVTTASLRSVAFASANRGWAVGTGGTVIHFDGRTWRKESTPTNRHLNAVAVAGADAIAAGDGATVLINSGRGWTQQYELDETLKYGQGADVPNLLSAAGLPDGTAFVGGAKSVLLDRAPGSAFRPSRIPSPEGSVHGLAVTRNNSGIKIFASVGSAGSKLAPSGLAEAVGWPFLYDSSGWHDMGAQRTMGASPDFNAPAHRDAVYAFAVDTARNTGWAVGGSPAQIPDEDGHVPATSTASVWRVDADRQPPASPSEQAVRVKPLPGQVNFAFLGGSACPAGLCSAVEGQGSRADTILVESLRQIKDSPASFVAYGGSMRRTGVPDELSAVKDLAGDLDVPFYASLGTQDLFGGLPLSGYYQSVFAQAPGPWGNTSAPRGFKPVDVGGPAADKSLSRTHYAFDFSGVRMIFVDTSRSIVANQSQFQNPAEDQVSWLANVLADARTKNLKPVVVMNQPFVAPATTGADAGAVTPVLATGTTLAVLASHEGVNRLVTSTAGNFPVGVFGGAGSRLERDWKPERGAYHSWQLVSVEPARASVSIRSMPVLESVALSLPVRTVGAGQTLSANGLGRAPDVGGAHAAGPAPDFAESRATYMPFPIKMTEDAFPPDYSFTCSDPSICVFVKDGGNGAPALDGQGRMQTDSKSGLMCALKPGTTDVVLQAGMVSSRIPVTVTAGGGPCIARPIIAPGSAPGEFPAALAQSNATTPTKISPQQPNTTYSRPPDVGAVGAIAPPIINPAPAPPAGGGGQKEEEREVVTEQAEMTALMIGVPIAFGFALRSRRRVSPAPAYTTRRHK